TPTLVPYTTLFRSGVAPARAQREDERATRERQPEEGALHYGGKGSGWLPILFASPVELCNRCDHAVVARNPGRARLGRVARVARSGARALGPAAGRRPADRRKAGRARAGNTAGPVAAPAAAIRRPHRAHAHPRPAARRRRAGRGRGRRGGARFPLPADAARGDRRRFARHPGAALLPLPRRAGRAVRTRRTGALLWHVASRPARAGEIGRAHV